MAGTARRMRQTFDTGVADPGGHVFPKTGVTGSSQYPVSGGIISFDEKDVLAPWQVKTEGGEIDLRFEPGAVHAEEHDFRVVASRFIQPAGSYSGTVRLPGREPLVLDRVLGVVEDQRVTW